MKTDLLTLACKCISTHQIELSYHKQQFGTSIFFFYLVLLTLVTPGLHIYSMFVYFMLSQPRRPDHAHPVPNELSPTDQTSRKDWQRFSGTSENIILKEASISAASKYVGIFNKENTYYANAILQALSVLPSFYFQEYL